METKTTKTTTLRGMATPWGQAQTSGEVAPGILHVTTAGHGGYRVSPELQLLIPAGLRTHNRWYEEDCEWAIVATYCPGFLAVIDDAGRRAMAAECAKGTMERHYASGTRGHDYH